MRFRLYTANYIVSIRLSEKKKFDHFCLLEEEFYPFSNGQKMERNSENNCHGMVTEDIKVEK